MAIHYSTYFGVDHEDLTIRGVFDACVDVDIKMHVDPLLLKKCQVPEFKDAYDLFFEYFNRFVDIVPMVKHPDSSDRFFRKMVEFFTLSEIPNTGLGYSEGHTHGHGISGSLSIQLANSAYEIIKAGIVNPKFFGWMQLIEDQMGADRISDMTIAILQNNFLSYTERVAHELNLAVRKYKTPYDSIYQVPFYKGKPIHFIPMDLLTDLPVANSWEEIDDVCSYNNALKRRVAGIIGVTWKEYNEYTKSDWKQILITNPDCYNEAIRLYDSLSGVGYDFNTDSKDVYYNVKLLRLIKSNPFKYIFNPKKKAADEIYDLSKAIIDQFKHLIEDRRLSELFYRKHRSPDETDWQLLLLTVAETYQKAGDFDAHVSREANPGVGEIDFQITRGSTANTAIEIKRSSNKDLLHGYRQQLAAYMRAENADNGIFIVIMEDNNIDEIKDKIRMVQEDMQAKGEYIPEVFYINCMKQPSASDPSYDSPALS